MRGATDAQKEKQIKHLKQSDIYTYKIMISTSKLTTLHRISMNLFEKALSY